MEGKSPCRRDNPSFRKLTGKEGESCLSIGDDHFRDNMFNITLFRHDNMQQHSGQHLVSAVLEKEQNINTMSWWMAENYPGKVESSLLWKFVKHPERRQLPPKI